MAKKQKWFRTAATDELSTQPIDLTNPIDTRYVRTVTAMTRHRSQRGWQWYREIGEIHYGISRNAKVAGYTTLRVVKRNPDGSPGEVIKGGVENEILQMLQSPYGGVRGFVERFFTLMKIPGDAYLIRCRDEEGDVEGYDWLSADEIERATLGESGLGIDIDPVFDPKETFNRILVPNYEGNGQMLTVPVQARDFVGRVWRPSGQFVALADSPMRALDASCEILHLLTTNIRAKLLSRFALNGIFFVPSEISNIRAGTPTGKANEQFHDNTVLDRLIAAATWAVQNHEQPEAAVPIFMTGPGQYADMIKHITYDRQIWEVDMKLRGELIDRILTGLDNSPSSVQGSQGSNHWSAWTASDEERRVNIQPDIETMCWALTRLVLWNEMQARGMKPGKITNAMIWYDMSQASAKTNLAEDSRQMRDRLLIADDAARRMSGISETDKPSDEEYVRMVGIKTDDPYLATFGLPIAKNIDWAKVGSKKTGPSADSPASESRVGPGVGDPGSPNDIKSDTPRRNRPA